MDEGTSQLVAQTIARLAEVTAKNTASLVSDKVKAAKAGRDNAKTINELEGIINELIEDKNELERIAKTLKNELISQQISEEDIEFIVSTVVPKVEELTKDDPKQQTYINAVKSLLSKETLKVVQLIGFNYREAIGVPLTELCSRAISQINSPKKQELEKLSTEREIELMQLSNDKNAHDRFARLINRPDLIFPDKEDPEEHNNAR